MPCLFEIERVAKVAINFWPCYIYDLHAFLHETHKNGLYSQKAREKNEKKNLYRNKIFARDKRNINQNKTWTVGE